MAFGIRQVTSLALAAATLASAPAIAQPPEAISDGLRCVYEKLTANRGYEVVAEVFLSDDRAGKPGRPGRPCILDLADAALRRAIQMERQPRLLRPPMSASMARRSTT